MGYYAFLHRLINYGVIAWGVAYKNKLNLLQQLQTRLLNIANKNIFNEHKIPLNVTQLFTLESLIYHYLTLRDIYTKTKRNTRDKNTQLPRNKKSYKP